MGKVLLSLVLFVGLVFGQGDSTVYQTLTSSLAVNTNYASSAVNNIGQTSHTAVLTVRSLGANTCTVVGTQFWIMFEGSYDGTNYFVVSLNSGLNTSTNNNITVPYSMQVSANYVIPYMRVRAFYNSSVGGVDCVGAVYYAASKGSISNLGERYKGAAVRNDVLTAGSPTLVYGGSTAINYGSRLRVVGLIANLVTAAGDENLTFTDAVFGVTSTIRLNATQPWVNIPITDTGIMLGTPGQTINISCTCASSNIRFTLWYREE